jgi:glycosyltransferase involved in cell wall biosynthesis
LTSSGGSLRVLHLVANRWWTGSADPVIRLIGGLGARGHQVRLALIAGDRFEAKAREAGITPLTDLSLDVKAMPWAWVSDVRRLRALVTREGIDVVHVHHSHDHWLGAACRGPAALVRTFHNQRAVRLSRVARALYRRAEAVIAVSRQIEDQARAAGIAPDRIHRIGGVVDLARFVEDADPAAVRAELGLGAAGVGSGPVIGSVARLAHNRGHELLIHGFKRFLGRYPRARLLLVGKGEARPRLEAMVRALGVEREVIFTGYRDGDLPAVLRALDTFVLVGAGSDESCRAALEAMAAGRPVVASRVGALPETVAHGETGLLLDEERPDCVETALAALAEDPARARRMGEAGRRRAMEEFSPERHAAQVETVYRAALTRRGART